MFCASEMRMVQVLGGIKQCLRVYHVLPTCSKIRIKGKPLKPFCCYVAYSNTLRCFSQNTSSYNIKGKPLSIVKGNFKCLGLKALLPKKDNSGKFCTQYTRHYSSITDSRHISRNHGAILSSKECLDDKTGVGGLAKQFRHYCSRCTFEIGRRPLGFRTSPPWRILFFGSDHFSLSSLKALNENRFDPGVTLVDHLEVVTSSGNQQSPVLKYADEAGLKVHHWPVTFDGEKYDVGVVSSFGHLIPERVIHMFPYGIINIHPSLLPRWRGASPITHTILNGDLVTGVSIMEIRPKHFDIGPLLMQREVMVPDGCTTGQLTDILMPMGTSMMMEVLEDLPTLERCEVDQEQRGITYAHKIGDDMYYIDWENQTVEDIDRQYRALHESGPIRSLYKGSRVKLFDLCHMEDLKVSRDYLKRLMLRDYGVTQEDQLQIGSTLYVKDQQAIIIRCKDGWVGFQHLVIRQHMRPAEFYGNYVRHCNQADRHFVSHPNHINQDVIKVKVSV